MNFQRSLSALAMVVAFRCPSFLALSEPVWQVASLLQTRPASERAVARSLADSLEKAVSQAPTLKLHTLVGLIFRHNDPSLRLFETVGFARWGVLPRIARRDVSRSATVLYLTTV